ncbi:MAG TPA: glycine zipper 2TM domain-containing protein [Ramlibacter sp.]|nr:glycine zipper 2TM domain-containing protein [Ramlibacter sp.]
MTIPARLSLIACTIASTAAFAQQPPAPQNAECRHCGVVESVQQVTRTNKAKGIAGTPVTPGMAVGGVLGGVVGNQIGHGSGRGAATVLGAAGGAYAGHEIERKGRQYAAYVMHIRMADGSMRTIEQKTPIARGSHVVVEGHTARLERGAPRHG